MKTNFTRLSVLGVLVIFLLGIGRCGDAPQEPGNSVVNADDGYRHITILQTNDIHGAVEPTVAKDGGFVGGMAVFGGIVKSIREGLEARYGARAGVLVVDGGDQFQGTLISNFNEGQLVFTTMNQVGYDAVVPGNHDYDFGPIGWLDDRVTQQTVDKNPRGALLRLAQQAKFPLLSANTYLKESLVDEIGNKVEVSGSGCKPVAQLTGETRGIVWGAAKRPDFLNAFTIKNVAGARVALVGLDNVNTPKTTTEVNVSDLCFRDEVETFLELRSSLDGLADVFVLILHNGNTDKEFPVTKLVEALYDASSTRSFRGNAVDAVVAGHTHFINRVEVGGVPVIQSSANGKMFGRIDLVWNSKLGVVERDKTKYYAGVQMLLDKCDAPGADFCSVSQQGVAYENIPLVPDAGISGQIATARLDIAPLAGKRLASAKVLISSDRIRESPLANIMSDALRAVAGTEIAIINTGGIRAPLKAGDITYENFFRVFPFNNRGVKIGPMSAQKLIGLLEHSARTCGAYGALMQSGLKAEFERDCKASAAQGTAGNEAGLELGVDSKARLLKVVTLSGVVLLDVNAGVMPPEDLSFTVATIDFLTSGGSGYDGFLGVPLIEDIGIMRESLADYFFMNQPVFDAVIDGRWRERR
ncbi:MAG: 5'-nucleotidase C-terminal domain-containing protein [Bdellovibrionota bacterium]